VTAGRLNTIAAVDTLIELCRAWRGSDVQLFFEPFHTQMILAQGQVMLVLAAVAAHQTAMGFLTARVNSEHLAAHHRASGVVLFVKIMAAQAVQQTEAPVLQTLPLGDKPVLVAVILQELALVKSLGRTILADRRNRFSASIQSPGSFHMLHKGLAIHPNLKVGVKQVTIILKYDIR
jgi:hypothetical protein